MAPSRAALDDVARSHRHVFLHFVVEIQNPFGLLLETRIMYSIMYIFAADK